MVDDQPATRVATIARTVWPPVALSGLLSVIAAGVTVWGSDVVQRTTLQMFVTLVVVIGLYIFSGNSGVLSFGHISFMAVGAYTSALLTVPPEIKGAILPSMPDALRWTLTVKMGIVTSTVIAGGVAVVVALLLAPALMRLSAIQASIATLAVLIITHVVILQTDNITRGATSIVGVPTDLSLWGALAWTVIAVATAYIYQESRHGLRLRASREDLLAARSVGVRVVAERSGAFVLSAFWGGVGGALFGHFAGAFNPDAFYFQITFLTIAMLIIGGLTSLTGAVIGVIFVSGVSEFFRRVESDGVGPIPAGKVPGLTDVIVAVILLLALIARPDGLMRGREIAWPGGRLRQAAHLLRASGKSREQRGSTRRVQIYLPWRNESGSAYLRDRGEAVGTAEKVGTAENRNDESVK